MKKLISLLLCIAIMLPIFTCVGNADGQLVEHDEPVAEAPTVSAHAAIMIDMETGKSLFEYDPDEQNFPGSTTKVMTAYLCLKYGDPDDVITVTEDAFCDITSAASTGGLKVGETMTVHRLLQALLVVSASEAANVVAIYISGSKEEFVKLMNKEAEELGCTGTHFNNCHGLPDDEHYTTVRDMSKIASAAMQYEEFRDIVGSAYTTMAETNMHSETTIQSTNGILPGSHYTEYNYPYAIGIKTGHTSKAGYCLISAADKDGKELLCVIYGCPSRYSSFQQTINLYEWAYNNYDIITYSWDKYVQTEDVTEEIDEYADDTEEEGIEADSEDSAFEEEASASESSAISAEEPAVEITPEPETSTVESAVSPVVSASVSAVETSSAESVISTAETKTELQNVLSNLTFENLFGPLFPLLILMIVIVILVIALIVTIVIAVKRKKK